MDNKQADWEAALAIIEAKRTLIMSRVQSYMDEHRESILKAVETMAKIAYSHSFIGLDDSVPTDIQARVVCYITTRCLALVFQPGAETWLGIDNKEQKEELEKIIESLIGAASYLVIEYLKQINEGVELKKLP